MIEDLKLSDGKQNPTRWNTSGLLFIYQWENLQIL